MIQRVRSEPYFQDSPLAATQVTVLFHIVCLRASEQSSATSMLGRHAICWMVNTISPDVGEWHVPDPNSAASRKAPDYFAIPHGDGWIEAMRVGIPRLLPEPRELRDRMQPHNIHPETHAGPWFERLQGQRMRSEESPRARPLGARPDARGAWVIGPRRS